MSTREYLKLAERLLGQAQRRPGDQLLLTRAAEAAGRLARLTLDDDSAQSGYLEPAADMLEPALTRPITREAIHGAHVYADLAITYARHQRQENEVRS